MNKPNFVVIMTDQQRADYLGCTGHPVLQTPNIDAIARTGTIMNRAHVTSPVCMPNRSVFVSGLMPSVTGVRQNGNDLPYSVRTFPQLLQQAGYDTALLGKSHLQTFTDRPPPIGENPAGSGRLSNPIDIGDEEQYLAEDPFNWEQKGSAAVELPFYGFDRADIVTRHGDRTGGAHMEWLRNKVDDPASLRGPENQLDHDYRCPQAIRTRLPEELYSTSYIRDMAVDFLTEPTRQNRPFFAFVSFNDPHHPFTPPGRYWDVYSPDDMPGSQDHPDHSNPPPHLAHVQSQPYADGTRFVTTASHVSHRQAQEAQALTCGMITMIDDAVGDVVAALEAHGLADNTIVVFTSDHGDYMGHHNMLLKAGLHFQSLLRVPMIWADPRIDQPAACDELVSTLDLAPTILAAADAGPNSGFQGVDLADLLSGKSATLERNDLLVEERTTYKGILGFEGQVRVRTLLHDRWRLSVYFGVEWGELHDLVEDPRECHNLWDDPDHASTKHELLFRLAQAQLAYDGNSSWPKRQA